MPFSVVKSTIKIKNKKNQYQKTILRDYDQNQTECVDVSGTLHN